MFVYRRDQDRMNLDVPTYKSNYSFFFFYPMKSEPQG